MNDTVTVLLVADDTGVRATARALLESDPDLRVTGTARSEAEALERASACRPDAVVIDAGMRSSDPLAIVATLAGAFALPVLVMSPLTFDGAQRAIDALERGALDFVPSDFETQRLDELRDEVVAKVRQAVRLMTRLDAETLPATAAHPGTVPPALQDLLPRGGRPYTAVLAALSTGGPRALLTMLPRIGAGFPLGMVIVQHSPARFTRTLAERLDGVCAVTVAEARDGDPVEPGTILIAPGGRHLTFLRDGATTRVVLSDGPRSSLYRPSADVTMRSASETFAGPLLGLVMTGMGSDGLEGTRGIKREGGTVLVQEHASCTAPGMPLAVLRAGLADSVLSLDAIPGMLIRLATA